MTLSRVALVGIDAAGEAHLLRLQLEHFGLRVALNQIGKPSDLFAAFSFYGQPADAAILCAHGDEGGIIFPQMAEGVDQLVLPGDRITSVLLSQRLKSVPPLVVSTACDTGSAAFAAAFHRAGAHTYVAPVLAPDGQDVGLWITAFFHARVRRGLTCAAALDAANALVVRENQFASY